MGSDAIGTWPASANRQDVEHNNRCGIGHYRSASYYLSLVLLIILAHLRHKGIEVRHIFYRPEIPLRICRSSPGSKELRAEDSGLPEMSPILSKPREFRSHEIWSDPSPQSDSDRIREQI